VAANPQVKPIDLGCEFADNWQLPSTSIVANVIITQPISGYSFDRFTVPRKVEGSVDLAIAAEEHSPCPRQHTAAAVAINTAARSVIRTSVL